MTMLPDTVESEVLGHLFLSSAWALGTGNWLTLMDVLPTDSTAGTEAPSVVRQSITWNAAATRTKTNSALIQFDTTAYGWAAQNVAGWAIMSASTLGNLICWAPFTGGAISVTSPAPVRLAATTGVVVDWTSAVNQISDFAVHSMLDLIFDGTAFASPADHEFLLHDGDPGVAGTANEFTEGGYVRKDVTFAEDTVTTWTRVRNTAQLDYTNLNSVGLDTPIAWWTVRAKTANQFLAVRDQTDETLSVGADGVLLANALEIRID